MDLYFPSMLVCTPANLEKLLPHFPIDPSTQKRIAFAPLAVAIDILVAIAAVLYLLAATDGSVIATVLRLVHSMMQGLGCIANVGGTFLCSEIDAPDTTYERMELLSVPARNPQPT